MPRPRAFVWAVAPGNKETTHGVVSDAHVTAMTTFWAPTGVDFAQIDAEWSDDAEEFNLLPGATTPSLVSRTGSIARKFRASPEVLAWLLGLMTGNVTSSSASANAAEVQTVTISGTPTSGSLVYSFKGQSTPPLAFDVATAALQAALEALTTIGTGGVTVSGSAGASYVITFAGSLANKQQPMIEVYASTPLGGGTSPAVAIVETTRGTAASVYTHTIQNPGQCIQNPPTTALVEGLACAGSTAARKLYAGVVVDTVSLEVSGKGPATLTAGLKFDGREWDRPTFTLPTAATSKTTLLGGHVTAFLGAALTTALPTASLRSVKVDMNAGFAAPEVMSLNPHVEEWQYGEGMPSYAISLSLKGDKSSDVWELYQAALDTQTLHKFRLNFEPTGGAQRRVRMDCNSVLVEKVAVTAQGTETRLDVTLRAFSNATDAGPATWTIETDRASYLVAI